MAFAFDVGRHRTFLSTRERGREVLHDLEDRTPPGTSLLVINFTNVEAMTVSFTDEFLGKYYSVLATQDDGPTTVLVTGLNDDTRETIVLGFERRELIALEQLGDDFALLAASDVLKDTFELARELETFTATTVAERLGITAPNANNRLKRLVAARALVRRRGVAERGGKEFTYSAPEI
ncbi:hypothetical protein GCM10023322_83060 [Rugosimonospora acidiphila]|uniref:Uncharacterized protein n=1 Tax=Rugosimonospora acidiphila TaxID=556531 RepID=A0ABP9SUZ0_9ACTN